MNELIKYWIDIISNDVGLNNPDFTIKYLEGFGDRLRIIELPNKDGVVCCVIYHDANFVKTCAELVIYIKKELRGNPLHLKKTLSILNETAVNNGCKCVTIGATIGYRDEKFLSILSRLGYRAINYRKDL